jgi:hypothetical protein
MYICLCGIGAKIFFLQEKNMKKQISLLIVLSVIASAISFGSMRLFALTMPELKIVKEVTLILPNSGGIPLKFKGVYDHIILLKDGSVRLFYPEGSSDMDWDLDSVHASWNAYSMFGWYAEYTLGGVVYKLTDSKGVYKDVFPGETESEMVFGLIEYDANWKENVKELRAENGQIKSIYEYAAGVQKK